MKASKFFFLVCLLLIGGQAFSQNGSSPFVNSTHTCTVNGGVAGTSTYLWSVLMADGSPATDAVDFTMTDGTTPAAKITWLKANVPANLTYIVQLEETNTCTTIRQFVVTVIGNAFDIAIADLTASCSDASGTVIVNSDNDNLGTTTKTFTIDMKTQADMTGATFIPDWKFDYEVTSTNGDLQTVTFDGNTAVTSPVVGTNSATGTVTVNNDDYSIQLTVVFNNTWNNGDVITVTLSNGIELTYNTPDGLNTNDEGAITINALPATTNITTD